VAKHSGNYFDKAAADHACGFCEDVLRQPDGSRVRLIPFQREILSGLLGWKRPDGTRLARRASIWLPKKSSKSWLAAALILYLLCTEEPGSEIYSVASSLRNAQIIFRQVARFARASPVLKRNLEINKTERRIILPGRDSFYEVLSSRPESNEGLNISALFFDELHRQRHDDLYNTLRWGGIARKQPLFCTISTAGVFDPLSVAYKDWREALDKEKGIIQDPSFYTYLRYAEPSDDIDDPRVWRKANPALGYIFSEDDFRRELEEAKRTPSKLAAFKRYRLNIWQSAANAFISDERWQQCRAEPLTDEQIKNATWFMGFDAASSLDITAAVFLGVLDGRYYCVPRFWINELQAEERTRQRLQFRDWIEDGYITVTPGETTSRDYILRDLEALTQKYKVEKIGMDRCEAMRLAEDLTARDYDVCFYRPFFADMSGPTKELERLVYELKLLHDGNPVLRWMISNCQLATDSVGNVRPDRKRSLDKIDGVVSLVIALAMAQRNFDSYWDKVSL